MEKEEKQLDNILKEAGYILKDDEWIKIIEHRITPAMYDDYRRMKLYRLYKHLK